jgi:hypothetical protein
MQSWERHVQFSKTGGQEFPLYAMVQWIYHLDCCANKLPVPLNENRAMVPVDQEKLEVNMPD